MRDLGLIFMRNGQSPYWQLKPLTWDIVADLGITRTLELLQAKHISYLSAISQTTEHIHLAVDITISRHRNKIMMRPIMGELDFVTLMKFSEIISNYINDTSIRFELNIKTYILPKITPTCANLSKIIGSMTYPAEFDPRPAIKVYSHSELQKIPLDIYDTLMGSDDTPVIRDGRIYFVLMSTKYSYIKNLKILNGVSYIMDIADVRNNIGDMIQVANNSEAETRSDTVDEGKPVAIVFNTEGVPDSTRLGMLYDNHKIIWLSEVPNSAESELKLSGCVYNRLITGYRKFLNSTGLRLLTLLCDHMNNNEITDVMQNILELYSSSDITKSEMFKIISILSPRCIEIPPMDNAP